MSNITEEQRIALEANGRYQAVAKQYVKFIAQYLMSQDGTPGEGGILKFGGRTPLQWGAQRNIAAGISLHPNSQSYEEWAAQMCMRLKGQDVWQAVADDDPAIALQKSIDATITWMINNGKFEELSNDVFALRGTRIAF